MLALRGTLFSLTAGALVACAGCTAFSPPGTALLQEQNRALAERARAYADDAASLRLQARALQAQLSRTEEEVARLADKSQVDQERLASYQEDRSFTSGVAGGPRLPPETSRRLASLSRHHPNLRFDSRAGIGKLDTDILFDSGSAELKPGAESALRELVRVLNEPEAQDLKVMVIGHTDDQLIARKAAREKYPNNFHLSADRAMAVRDALHKLGLADSRLGIAGYASQQPAAPGRSAVDRQNNRRVELLVMVPEVPVVGWAETTSSLRR
jgi:chemotaxis protein MotB